MRNACWWDMPTTSRRGDETTPQGGSVVEYALVAGLIVSAGGFVIGTGLDVEIAAPLVTYVGLSV